MISILIAASPIASGENPGSELEPVMTIISDIDLEKITIDGTYQGENISINNHISEITSQHTISKIYINGVISPSQDSDVVICDLSNNQIGDYINVEILYRGAKPTIVNPKALLSKSTFTLTDYDFSDGKLNWETLGESNFEPFYIECYKNNKWVPIAKVMSFGPGSKNSYSLEVDNHSGRNVYRIKQHDKYNRYAFSPRMVHYSDKTPITAYPEIFLNKIYLTESTYFELFDDQGNLITKGNNHVVDASGLTAGVYYLNIENRTETLYKR